MLFAKRQNYNESDMRRRRLLAAIPPGMSRLLDVGCGDGFVTAGLAETARQIVAVDYLYDSLGRTRARRNGINALFAQIDPNRCYPFKDGSFDVITGFEVIEHCREPRKFLDEMARLLSADGLLVLSTPNYKNFQRRLGVRALRGLPRFPSFPIHWAGESEEGTHFREFEPAELRALLAESGFRTEALV